MPSKGWQGMTAPVPDKDWPRYSIQDSVANIVNFVSFGIGQKVEHRPMLA